MPIKDPVITGKGTSNEIRWQIERDSVNSLVSQVPRSRTTLQNLPKLDDGSMWGAAWSLSDDDALTMEQMTFTEADGINPHLVCDYLQWRNLRLIQFAPDDRTIVKEVPFSLRGKCTEVLLLNQPGQRVGDNGKTFAWGVVAAYQVTGVQIAGLKYTVRIKQAFLFATPAGDVQPSATVIGVKAFPTLEATLVPEFQASSTSNSDVSFGADLKMVFAPRLTSTAQQRPDPFFVEGSSGTVLVSTHSDTNGRNRNPPGALPPRYPDWNRLFDYAEPDIKNEFAFQAVVNSGNAGSGEVFTIAGYSPPSDSLGAAMGGAKDLECYRVLGQGEFDSLHVHPYVGFDNPKGATVNDANNVNMVEAPIAADEVMHLHWRWGYKLPATADSPALASEMKGYASDGTPNQSEGAPLIPPNQSLRIKVARPRRDGVDAANDNGQDPKGVVPLAADAIAVWYCPIAHRPDYLALSPFCGHGFALVYEWLGKAIGTNEDLLDDPNVNFSYHSLRWDRKGKQRVPTASTLPGLSRNRIWDNDPGFDKGSF